MNANHITATTAINHMRPLTLVAFIRDLADAPDTLPGERADLLRATLDALSASIGAQNAIALLAAAAGLRCVRRAGVVDAWVQPDMFPSGEDTPPFTQPDAPAEPCSRCNRHPAESGLARWHGCDVCGAPVCDTCAWNDPHGAGHYCSTECAFGADPDQM